MKKVYNVLVWFMLLPLLLSLRAVHDGSVWLGVAAVLSVFLLVGIMPFCHRHENIWLFVIFAYSLIPINLTVVNTAMECMEYTMATRGILYWLTYVEYMLILASVEEVFAGLVGKFLWRKQYKPRIS